MKGTKILMAAIMCAMLTLGIGGTSSAAELSSDLSTMQVKTQEFSSRHHNRTPPPPPCYDGRGRGDNFGRTSYGPSGRNYDRSRNNRGWTNSRQVNIKIRRVTVRV